MNDDDYASALREELENLNNLVAEARKEREKGRRLLDHLKAEKASLEQQRKQRDQRQQQGLQVHLLQKQIEAKKLQKTEILLQLTQAHRQLQEQQMTASLGSLASEGLFHRQSMQSASSLSNQSGESSSYLSLQGNKSGHYSRGQHERAVSEQNTIDEGWEQEGETGHPTESSMKANDHPTEEDERVVEIEEEDSIKTDTSKERRRFDLV